MSYPNDKKIPEGLKKGEVGIIKKVEGNLLDIDSLRPAGDVLDDWSFAIGFVPKENVIINPSLKDLESLSSIYRLKVGQMKLTDSVTGEVSFDTIDTSNGGIFRKAIKKEKDRILIELPGGANPAWVSRNDVNQSLEYFIGNPGN